MKSVIWSPTQEIIDRDVESDEIITDIKQNISPKINILFSKTARGKSSLVAKVCDKYDGIKYDTIRVRSLPNNDIDENAWEFLDLIFDKVCTYYEKEDELDYCSFTFEHYLFEAKDPEINELRRSSITDKIVAAEDKKKMIRNLIHIAAKRELKMDEFSVQKYKHDESFLGKRVRSNYIKYVITNRPILLMIDNIQNMGRYTLLCINEWLSAAKDNAPYFLFEYTLDETDDHTGLNTLISTFNPYATVVATLVPDLPSKYITDVISRKVNEIPKEIDFNVDILKHYTTESNGNLKEIIDYSFTYHKEENRNVDSENGTYKNIKTVSEPSGKYLLSILILENGKMPVTILKKVIGYSIDIETTLQELSEHNLVNIYQQNVELDHASIKEQWDKNISEFMTFDDLAYKSLKEYYYPLLESSDIEIQNNAWKHLLHLYSQREPFLIKQLLPHLEEKIAVSVSLENSWKYICDVYNHIKKDEQDYEHVIFRLLEICFKLELYKEGAEIIAELDNDYIKNSKLLLIHKLLYLVANDQHESAVKEYEKALSYIDMESRTGLNIMLSVLSSYRYTGRLEECKKINTSILKNSSYRRYPEYAFFLRLTNIYLPNKKSLKYTKKSVEIFREKKNKYQEGKSLITYAKLLAGLGRLDSALNELSRAEELLSSYNIRSNVLWVNRSAMLLMQGNHDKYVWELLCKSDYTAITPYDRLAIVIVKLAWCYENSDFTQIDALITEGEKCVKEEPDQHIHALFFYNVYVLSNLQKKEVVANSYYQKAYQLKDKSRYIKARFEGTRNKEEQERLKNPWYICYLSFWSHDVEYYED